MRRIAYIPARGGSKGIPQKNIKKLCGRPLISYTIEAAKQCGKFDRIFVSTDSEEIASISQNFGAWVPFLREAQFAQDDSRTIDAMVSDKKRLEAIGEFFDVVCLLQPTSPMRTSSDIAGAIELFDKVGNGVLSVSPVDEHPYYMRAFAEGSLLEKVLHVSGSIRRQDLKQYYKLNGAIYVNFWSDISPSLIPSDNPYGYIMGPSIDIDTVDDFNRIEKEVRARTGNNS